jgi:hypothetical protein
MKNQVEAQRAFDKTPKTAIWQSFIRNHIIGISSRARIYIDSLRLIQFYTIDFMD